MINLTGKLARWAGKLRHYSFDLVHLKGSSNVASDALSRIPPDDKDEVVNVENVYLLEVQPRESDA